MSEPCGLVGAKPHLPLLAWGVPLLGDPFFPHRPLLAPPVGSPEPWKKGSCGYKDSAFIPEKLDGSPRGLGRWVTQWVARGLWIQTFPFILAARTHACPWSAVCGVAPELPSSST